MQGAGIHARWAGEIAQWVAANATFAAPTNAYSDSDSASDRPLTFCVEGNIGAGKSTYLNMVHQHGQPAVGVPQAMHGHEVQEVLEVQVVPEPVDMWQKLPCNENLLDLFYNDQRRWAFLFQSYVLMTRIQRVRSRRRRRRRRCCCCRCCCCRCCCCCNAAPVHLCALLRQHLPKNEDAQLSTKTAQCDNCACLRCAQRCSNGSLHSSFVCKRTKPDLLCMS